MINVTYTNAAGTTIDLLGARLRATDGMVHNHKWTMTTNKRVFGTSITAFKKDAMTHSITLTLRGSLDERKAAIDHLVETFDHDVIRKTPGRLQFGDWYIDCYITEMEVEPGDRPFWTNVKMSVYAPYPFWIMELEKDFQISEGSSGEGDLDYDYDYEHDLKSDSEGSSVWTVDHYADSEFRMIIFGPCTNPRVVISGHAYQVNVTLGSNEYLEIDSRNNTIYKISRTGVRTNCFKDRETSSSVFEKIPSGRNVITWAGTFGFNITLYMERSEPRWIS